MMLITLEQAKKHLRVDGDDDDDDITLKVHAASGAVKNYLKSAANAYFDAAGVVLLDAVPFEVMAATQLMLGYLYNQRDEDAGREFESGYLPRPVTALLSPLRDPALA